MTNLSNVLGIRRQGKTTFALSLGIRRHSTVIFWDVNDQLHGWPLTAEDPAIVSQWLETGEDPMVIVIKPRRGNMKAQFSQLVDVVFPWEDVALVVDEASELQGPHWIDESLEHLVRRWNDFCTLIQCTHRFRDLNPLARQNANDTYLFFSDYAPDLTVIGEFLGDDVAESVARLKRFEVAHVWREEGGFRRYAVWNDPAPWFVPLNAEEIYASS